MIWGGHRLDRLDALILEAPVVSWPQPRAEGRPGELGEELQRRGMALRERGALHAAALRMLAGHVRSANHPTRAAELAMSPALALERLAAAGVPLRPWRIGPIGEAGTTRVALTAERGLAPAEGATCLTVELADSGLARHLCVGGEWLASTRAELGPPLDLAQAAPSAERELALAALAALGLEFGCVVLSGGAVALVESAADLDAWDAACGGRVADALAHWLVRVPQPTP